MAAPKGNSYYLLAVGFKKPKKYKPSGLWKKAIEYVKWVADNPLKEEKVFPSGKRMKVDKMRAMTMQEFCLFANINRDTFYAYEKEKEYSDICGRIKDLFYAQKVQGAAADLLNQALISRELGLIDKSELGGPNGGPIPLRSTSDIDLTKLPTEVLLALHNAPKKANE